MPTDPKPQTDPVDSILSAVMTVVLWPPMMLLRAWAIQILWGWYLAATLGLLSFQQALGASLLISFVRGGGGSGEGTGLKAVFMAAGSAVLLTAILLATGWVLRGVA